VSHGVAEALTRNRFRTTVTSMRLEFWIQQSQHGCPASLALLELVEHLDLAQVLVQAESIAQRILPERGDKLECTKLLNNAARVAESWTLDPCQSLKAFLIAPASSPYLAPG
jgi:hypothetical protein